MLSVANGVEMLTKITAAGCSVTAIMAACISIGRFRAVDTICAAAFGLGVFGCGLCWQPHINLLYVVKSFEEIPWMVADPMLHNHNKSSWPYNADSGVLQSMHFVGCIGI